MSIFEPKTNISFQNIPLEAKLYITDPLSLGILKQNSREISKHPVFYRNHKNFAYHQPISFFKSLYIYSLLAIYIFGTISLLIFSQFTNNGFISFKTLTLSILVYSPQLAIFMWYKFELLFKNKDFVKDLLKNSPKFVLKGFFTLFNLILNSILVFYLPLKIEVLPCLKEIKETWCVNFLPSLYVIIVKFLYQIYWVYEIETVLSFGRSNLKTYYYKNDQLDEQKINIILDENSIVRHVYNMCICANYILMCFNLMQIFSQIYNYLQGEKIKLETDFYEQQQNFNQQRYDPVQSNKHFQSLSQDISQMYFETEDSDEESSSIIKHQQQLRQQKQQTNKIIENLG